MNPNSNSDSSSSSSSSSHLSNNRNSSDAHSHPSPPTTDKKKMGYSPRLRMRKRSGGATKSTEHHFSMIGTRSRTSGTRRKLSDSIFQRDILRRSGSSGTLDSPSPSTAMEEEKFIVDDDASESSAYQLEMESYLFVKHILEVALCLFILSFLGLVAFVRDEGSHMDPLPHDTARYTAQSVTIAFLLFLLSGLHNYSQQVTRPKKQVCLVVIYLNIIAVLVNLSLSFNWTPILKDFNGKPLYPIRYLELIFTSPMCILLSPRMVISIQFPQRACRKDTQLARAIIFHSIAMTCTFIGTYAANPLIRHYCILVGFVFFGWNLYSLYLDFKTYMSCPHVSSLQSSTSLQILRGITFLKRLRFPIFWIISRLGLLPLNTEILIWVLTDLAAKFYLSVLLLNGNFAVLERIQLFNHIRTKEYYKQLEEEKRRVELDSSLQRNFFAVSAHELRTPLNSIIAFNELLYEMEDVQLKRDYINSSLTSAKALLSVINNVLDYSKYSSEEWELDQNSFHIYQLLDDTIDIMSAQVSIDNIHFEITCLSCRDIKLVGDVTRIRQVLLNFLTNAVRSSGKDSDVYLNVGALCENEEEIELQFSVIDHGVGIDAYSLQKLFHPYSQLGNIKRKQQGTGLGLVICKNIVNKMKGTIKVESVVNEGSNFSFTIPVKKSERTDSYSSLEGRIGQVILFTAKSTFGESMTNILMEWGASGVELCSDVPNENTDTSRYDMVIVDLSDLEDKSGFKNLIEGQQCLFLAPLRNMEEMATLVPTEKLLSKPVKFISLYSAITRIVNRTRETTTDKESSKARTELLISENTTTKIIPEKKNFRILVVDDNRLNQKVASAILKNDGYVFDVASDGVEAVDMAHETSYDVILMDLNMPRMNGLEATKSIRRMETVHKSYIVAVTADSSEETKRKCMAHGMNNVIIKPVIKKILSQLLQKQYDMKVKTTVGSP